MSISTSPSTGKIYGLKRVCSVWKIARSTVYERRRRTRSKAVKQKPGPKPKISDESLLQAVRQDIKDSLFHGEGHKKIHARLRRHKGICVGRNRVLKLMRKNNLLSPYRYVQEKAKKHDGRITTDNPNVLWGTDATKILTVDDGWVWFFGLIEHWNAECMGWYMAKKGDRFVAIEALQQAIRAEYGSIGRGVAQGLQVRPDHGPQFTSDDFLKQLRYWGITPSFSFVREPETNGVVERFHRTYKEQVIHGRLYRNIEEVREVTREFIENYNEHWLLEKLSYHSPREARRIRKLKNVA